MNGPLTRNVLKLKLVQWFELSNVTINEPTRFGHNTKIDTAFSWVINDLRRAGFITFNKSLCSVTPSGTLFLKSLAMDRSTLTDASPLFAAYMKEAKEKPKPIAESLEMQLSKISVMVKRARQLAKAA